MNKIQNPLTIIGLFAGIAEVAGTVVLPLVHESLQSVFVWYVMGFPIVLIILFFVTLNKNPKVLYAPSDFTDEENFMELLTKADSAIKETISNNPEIMSNLQPLDKLVENVAVRIKNDETDNFETSLLIQDKNNNTPSICYEGQHYKLDGDEIIIGRDGDADIRITTLTVSRSHCSITREQDEYFLQDLNSTSGTYLDREKISPDKSYKLSDGANIQVSNTVLMFCGCKNGQFQQSKN